MLVLVCTNIHPMGMLRSSTVAAEIPKLDIEVPRVSAATDRYKQVGYLCICRVPEFHSVAHKGVGACNSLASHDG